MGINNIGRIFMPKNKVFYGLFEDVADTVFEMGKMLKQLVNEPDVNIRASLTSKLEDLEHRNDEHTHRLFTELSRNFITPFDREDIHYLATSLDDIADYIFASAKKISFYRVNPNDSGMQKMAELIEQACLEIRVAVMGLRDMKNLRAMTEAMVKINSIENQADDVFDMSIEILFQKENDFKEVIKKREIYQVMEVATDKCEDAANVIESIIVKYA
ncbi:MAG: phosphate transport regulator [Chitinophagaceae bacterium]|nr:phosphate transport regulator [Chitinophagaceae bacterium]